MFTSCCCVSKKALKKQSELNETEKNGGENAIVEKSDENPLEAATIALKNQNPNENVKENCDKQQKASYGLDSLTSDCTENSNDRNNNSSEDDNNKSGLIGDGLVGNWKNFIFTDLSMEEIRRFSPSIFLSQNFPFESIFNSIDVALHVLHLK